MTYIPHEPCWEHEFGHPASETGAMIDASVHTKVVFIGLQEREERVQLRLQLMTANLTEFSQRLF